MIALCHPSSGGVPEAFFGNLAFGDISHFAKGHKKALEKHSHLTGVTAGRLRRWHLSDMKVIFHM